MKGFGFIAAVSTLVIELEVSKFWPRPQTERSFPFSKVFCHWQVRNYICSDDQCLRIPRLRSPCGPPSKELKLTVRLVTEVLGLEEMGLLSGGHWVLSLSVRHHWLTVVTGQLLFFPLQEVNWGLIPEPSGFSPPWSIASVLSVSV